MPYGNTISSDDTHSNEYAAGTVSNQSFTERKEIENSRNVVKSYQHSQIIGQNFAPHGEYARAKPRAQNTSERKVTRQEMNANGRFIPNRPAAEPTHRQTANSRPRVNFREPPARGYNPYA